MNLVCRYGPVWRTVISGIGMLLPFVEVLLASSSRNVGLGLRPGVVDGAISISAVQVGIYDRTRPRKKAKINKNGKGKEWVFKKKEQMRRKGYSVPPDTKYTARKRKAHF
ncbi:hypothetical protein B296_00012537 [Ensete ventricosum]|uniref:18S rRNA (guanine(1575)-N(7))-methyltransferase Bud23 C-terminal domain-containing protein n=1 Tax=Ensete ventricosum TaxID=4639 RepID=A0A427B086_ENSVE|nr:hypothetical protein B296_00012537 [Ensete ventricosum]